MTLQQLVFHGFGRLIRALAVVASCLAFACGTPPSGAQPVSALPKADLTSIGGHTQLSAAISGRTAVVHFWATWCDACEVEQSKLERLAAAFSREELGIAGVAVGEEPETVAAYIAKRGERFPNFVDTDFKFANAVRAKSVPLTFVLDQDGRIVHSTKTLDEAALAQIRHLLR